ncbi:MAG TPA: amidohydrolase family protein [Gemmatimonadales bacterium]|jgi:imidazolonepropionase-like amidohydrolase|nr:amidohydrolase family protein [Gemmatimonadales bacterium]
MRLTSAARAFVLGAVLFPLASRSSVAQSDTWALTNVRIQTVTRGVIEKGTVLIRKGLIEAVGATVTVPPDARVLDLSGKTVSPGLLDLTSSLGLPAPAAPGGGGGGGAPPAAAPAQGGTRPGLDPEREVARELKVPPADIKPIRDLGVTAVLVAPPRGLFRGASALVPLRDSVTPSEIIRAPVAMHLGYQGVSGYPGTLLGVITYQRQALYDAQRQALLLDRYKANPRGMERPEHNASVDALVPVVRGQLPLFIDANNENEIRRAVRLAKEFNLKATVIGATEGFEAVDALSGSTAVVSVNFPQPAQTTKWSYRLSQRRPPGDSAASAREAQKLIEGNAATLNKAGIKFALASGGSRDFLPNVRKAIAAGLPANVALEAVTIRAAELAGAAEMLGSIEAGKIANLVVSNGDILSDSAKVSAVFVDGVRYEVAPPPAPARASVSGSGGGGGAAPPAQMAGTWALNLTSPQGPMDITMVLTQSGSSFSGTMTSMMGTSDISEGQITGRTATWSMTLQFGGQSITLNYRGEVDGNRMTGTAELGSFGSATFTAERKP